ncbi:DUF1643 domain-containing protein [Paenibacillus cremeus]|uniref:DUF1643 domain-containing protein n=1 Tax=Paenibacillus cremeus TaxID=2163881 RepID=UPI001649166B|nr:DUF1643 domain-containing protein [Paenibacillus cremeus]
MIIPVPRKSFQVAHEKIKGAAVFHPKYQPETTNPKVKRRYLLHRLWSSDLPVMTAFLMNPSAADELVGDDTVDYIVRYAKHNGGVLEATVAVQQKAASWSCLHGPFHSGMGNRNLSQNPH